MDDVDFTALATRASAGLDGLRACLLLSSDGLTLGVYPPAGEERAREAWDRLEQLGDPRRGFIDVGEELWAVLRSGPYTGVLVTGPGAKPGLLLDKLEVLLRAAEEARTRGAVETSTAPARPEATRRRRTSLHAEPKPDPAVPRAPKAPKPPKKATAAEPAAAVAPRYAAPDVLRGAAKRVVDITLAAAEQQQEPAAAATSDGAPAAPAQAPSRPVPTGPADDAEVDRVALAREFGALLADRDGEG